MSVIDYVSDNDFILELKTKATNDRLLLARLKPGTTLKDTIDTVLTRVKKATPTEWQADNIFKAPAIRLHIAKRYFDVHMEKFTANATGQTLLFEDAVQDTRFVLDEKGAVLVSQAVIEAERINGMARNFVCNGPFLVLMLRKNAKLPYFALWIANTELLQPAPFSLPLLPEIFR